jgi:hypothetical protein
MSRSFHINQSIKDLIIHHAKQLVNCHIKMFCVRSRRERHTKANSLMTLNAQNILSTPLSLSSTSAKQFLALNVNSRVSHEYPDIESEPPPEPAPPEVMPFPHRDMSMASINAIAVKPPSNFVLKIDKNGDQIHEEFIPQSQHGKSSSSHLSPAHSHPLRCQTPRRNSDDAASRHKR